MKKKNIFSVELDKEEQELLDSVERDEWKRANDFDKELAFAKEAASNALRKDERITLRLGSRDLARLKRLATYKGLPYQTFIASVLHEYAAGHFVEVK